MAAVLALGCQGPFLGLVSVDIFWTLHLWSIHGVTFRKRKQKPIAFGELKLSGIEGTTPLRET